MHCGIRCRQSNPIPTHALPLKGRASSADAVKFSPSSVYCEPKKTLPFKGVKDRRSEPQVLTVLNA